MNYDLAKKLKDAGFEQTGNGTHPFGSNLRDEEECYAPTLSELIGACGEDFVNLQREWGEEGNAKFYTAIGSAVSSPTVGDYESKASRMETGGDPEEAVANLWLALHA